MNNHKFLFLLSGLLLAVSSLAAIDDPGRKISSYAVKGNQKQWQVDQFGNKTMFEYNSQGQLVETSLDGRVNMEYSYSNDGRLRAVRDEFGRETMCKYDISGRIAELTNPLGQVSKFSYDPYGRLVRRSGVGKYPMNYEYTSFGEIASYTDQNGSTTKFEYDNAGRLVKRIWPNGTSVEFKYNKESRLAVKAEANRVTDYVYSDKGRLVKIHISQGMDKHHVTEMKYNDLGQMVSISAEGKTTHFAYDRFGRKLLEESPVGTFAYMYDDAGRLKTRKAQFRNSGTKFITDYKYDEFNRVIEVSSPAGIYKYAWGQNNKIAAIKFGNDQEITYTYDNDNRLVSKKLGDRLLVSYQYDALNRRIAASYLDVEWKYGYDQYSQLIKAESSLNENYEYNYDAIGNRTVATALTLNQNFTFNGMNQISNNGYAYDAWGNMTMTPGAEYKYDLKNRLVEYKKGDLTIAYTYDALDQRISAVENGKRTDYLMSGMVEYARRSDSETQYHTLGLDVIGSMDRTGAAGAVLATSSAHNSQFITFNYLYDGNGNVIASCDANGIITGKLTYAPFGKQTSGVKLPFTFSTKAADSSDLSYYGHRFYDNSTGKWLSKDLLAEQGGMNLYAFVDNVALNAIDALGAVPVGTTVGNAVWDGTKWIAETTVAAGVKSGDATWDGTKWVAETTVAAGTTVAGAIWDGLKWLGSGILAIGTTVGKAVWNGTVWVTEVVVTAAVTAGNATWDGAKWIAETTVDAGIWVGEEMWDGAKWVYAKTMSIDLGECGSAAWQRALIPDAPMGFDFSECCRKHDKCYETKCVKKSACETAFYNCMDSKAQANSKWYRPGIVGTAFAGIFYLSVEKFGCAAFKSAQAAAGNPNATCD